MSRPAARVSHPVQVGEVLAPFGVRGWVRVRSDTSEPMALLGYVPWYLWLDGAWRRFEPEQGRPGAGRGTLVCRLRGVNDREAAGALRGASIAAERAALGEAEPGTYYWCDLVGTRVYTVDGVDLGEVVRLMETGANDVLVVRGERERLVPYVPGDVVRHVDLAHRRLEVDWDPDF